MVILLSTLLGMASVVILLAVIFATLVGIEAVVALIIAALCITAAILLLRRA